MDLWTLGVLAVGLGADAFSVAVGIGLGGVRRRDAVLLGVVVAIFHVIMPWLGLVAGNYLGFLVGQMASFIGAGILFFLGGSMVYKAWFKEPVSIGLSGGRRLLSSGSLGVVEATPFTPTLSGLTVLGAGVSMDALSVGFSLGTVGAALLPTVLTFGVVAGLMTVAGCLIGREVGRSVGAYAQLIGGLILIAIGVKLLL